MIAKVMEMERIVEQAFLYDFYGELLTEHQRQVYEDFVLNDLSLSEIAEDRGISRQGVHDLVKRCDKILGDYESKLHLVETFLDTKQKVRNIHELIRELLTAALDQDEQIEKLQKMEALADDILEHL
ncbi:MAG: YlxM family DNA-binding protein [Lachnospiraceae bacterium]|nr:YlxM family DNA-binding protein [Lachnospiraceae bacterium]